jgi:hypothetical protein
VLRRIIVTKRDKMTGGRRKLYNEKPHNLHPSRNIIRMVRSRKVRVTGHVACMEKKRNV